MTRAEYLHETLEFYKDLRERTTKKLLAINLDQYEGQALIFIEHDRERTIKEIEYYNNLIAELKTEIENE
ncbi:hypothetical protein [Acinetobacter bereziniae]|uniref:Uncharacterized protein n=1 Tax=Acinetobacter bereziniae NIPH 3 TaxID=1217651 RepID=N8YN33_ACIBZ|nr:hypothetical protein [Acinetobacter bereziniae]ENV20973.1 hypothetical protein F963_03104 [Acinetobacter bereziniae NIPH 3]